MVRIDFWDPLPEHKAMSETLMSDTVTITRRPIKARGTRWAGGIARFLTRIGLKPNHISLLSIAFSLLASICLGYTYINTSANVIIGYALAAVFIQGRLLCNLFDGMVAVEGGLKTKSGEVYNDLPDRIADPLILIGTGYAAGSIAFGVELGYVAAMLAILTAYIRVLGGSAGLPQVFLGPMAKQHRMAVITCALIVGAAVSPFGRHDETLAVALVVIICGCVITCVRRTRAIVRGLEASR